MPAHRASRKPETDRSAAKHGPARKRGLQLEWPTLAVAAAIYGGFGLVTWFHAALPWYLELAFGSYLIAWHASLQHEVVHGHPTSRSWLNRLIVLPNLWLWLPYEIYRETHLRHHRDRWLTDPAEDPESYYIAPARWALLGGVERTSLRLRNTVIGRLALGPLFCVAGFYRRESLRLLRGDPRRPRIWALHAVSVGLVLTWAMGVAGLSFWQLLLLYVYPGIALAHLRSFLEHRAHPDVAGRTAIVETGPLLSLLFLNNNLHSVHHNRPRLPWYRIPAVWRAEREAILRANDGYYLAGYGTILRRWAVTPKEPSLHPLGGVARDGRGGERVAFAAKSDVAGMDRKEPATI
ncbi:fatty acid desaturase [Algihabitans albus]|uniref:fatty acid desaturase n=1 Tax=Algihabitans albus TaxID=2164067 RepID=UPI000E5D6AF1|nr:fatty acid desaturase [Algihabitans albus]